MEEEERFNMWKGLDPLMLALKMEERTMNQCHHRWHLDAWNGLQFISSKKMKISRLPSQESGFCQQPEWAMDKIHPPGPSERNNTVNTFSPMIRPMSDFWTTESKVISVLILLGKQQKINTGSHSFIQNRMFLPPWPWMAHKREQLSFKREAEGKE